MARRASIRRATPARHRTVGANVTKLLQALAGVPQPQRTARFRCVIVVARPDGQTLVADGSCEGRITERPCGSGGFGYDPVFFYPPAGMTFAELPAAAQECR